MSFEGRGLASTQQPIQCSPPLRVSLPDVLAEDAFNHAHMPTSSTGGELCHAGDRTARPNMIIAWEHTQASCLCRVYRRCGCIHEACRPLSLAGATFLVKRKRFPASS